jgi:restriction system protein
MSIPTYDKFIEPILRYLAAVPGDRKAREVHDAAADSRGLSPETQLLVYNSGQPVYKNRAGWAHDRWKRAGLSASPRRGYWQLTPEGRNFAKVHPAPLDAALGVSLKPLFRPEFDGDYFDE